MTGSGAKHPAFSTAFRARASRRGASFSKAFKRQAYSFSRKGRTSSPQSGRMIDETPALQSKATGTQPADMASTKTRPKLSNVETRHITEAFRKKGAGSCCQPSKRTFPTFRDRANRSNFPFSGPCPTKTRFQPGTSFQIRVQMRNSRSTRLSLYVMRPQ